MRWLGPAVLAVVVAVGVTALLLLRGGDEVRPVTLPASVAGFVHDTTSSGKRLDQFVQYKAGKVSGKAGAAVFARGGGAELLVVVAVPAQRDNGPTLTKLETAVTGIDGSIHSVTVEPSGAHGGHSQCGIVVPDPAQPPVCEWWDAHTAGILLAHADGAPVMSRSELNQIELALRDAID